MAARAWCKVVVVVVVVEEEEEEEEEKAQQTGMRFPRHTFSKVPCISNSIQ